MSDEKQTTEPDEAVPAAEASEAAPEGSDEVLLMMNRSIWWKPGTLLLSTLLTLVPLVLVFILDTNDIARYLLGALCLAGLSWLLYYLFNTKMCATYTITKRRCTAEMGFISREIREVEIRHIRNINVRQTIMQRLFGLGDVDIATSGQSGVEVEFVAVHDPLHVRRLIMGTK